jgi:hypothetical protein
MEVIIKDQLVHSLANKGDINKHQQTIQMVKLLPLGGATYHPFPLPVRFRDL